MMIDAPTFEPLYDDLAQVLAAGDGAKAGLTGLKAPGRAGIYELPGHVFASDGQVQDSGTRSGTI